MDKYVVKGAKKLFGLARTKIRLAKEAETVRVRPEPLPLVELISGVQVRTVDEAIDRVSDLRSLIDYENMGSVAPTVLELMDIIEGVKYRFEPPELCVLVGNEELKSIEKMVNDGVSLSISLMSEKPVDGINIYIGYNPPKGAIHYGRVPTTLSHYLAYAFRSEVLSDNMYLKNTHISLGHRTLILNAIYHSILNYVAGEDRGQ